MAEEGVQQFYSNEGLSPPITIWVSSPEQGALVADILSSVKALGPRNAATCLWDVFRMPSPTASLLRWEELLSEVRSQIWQRAWEVTARQIGNQFDACAVPLARPMYHGAIHFQVWPHVVGHKNTLRLESHGHQPAAANSLLERAYLRTAFNLDSLHTAHAHYQYDLGESGWTITTQLEALGLCSGMSSSAVAGFPLAQPKQAHWMYQIAKNCGWLWLFDGVCVLTDLPEVRCMDEADRLHCADGPAIRYGDGCKVFAWHGVAVPKNVITSPSQITVRMIKEETNSEIRSVMIERYGGLARYAADGGFKLLDEASPNHIQPGLRSARLWLSDEEDDFDEDGQALPTIYVDLLNSTPEPDGACKWYLLRIDPTAYDGEAATNVHAATASTWRNADGSLTFSDWRDYAPVLES